LHLPLSFILLRDAPAAADFMAFAAGQRPFYLKMTCDSREFFTSFLRELEQRKISPVNSPAQPTSDGPVFNEVKYTVPSAAVGQLRRIQIELATQNNWALVQTFQQSATVLDTVLLNIDNPGESLKLNATASDAGTVQRSPAPTGICLAVLGSDGAGKSTLLARLQEMLKPCFLEQRTMHFRPAVFEKQKSGVVTDPHGRPPRDVVSSALKTGYYFLDNWVGWLRVVRPAKKRGSLVIFDRNFDDMLVDQRRYRLKGVAGLVRVLRSFLPDPDLTFVLTAPAELLHQRKPELPLEELARQQEALRKLASRGKDYVLVSADQSPGQVANTVWREVVKLLATHEEQRTS
jgi:thymidylate kinase